MYLNDYILYLLIGLMLQGGLMFWLAGRVANETVNDVRQKLGQEPQSSSVEVVEVEVISAYDMSQRERNYEMRNEAQAAEHLILLSSHRERGHTPPIRQAHSEWNESLRIIR